MRLRMSPSTWVVFEGLDATGKTTQLDSLRLQPDLFDPPPLFTHQPSGNSVFTEMLYEITEDYDIQSSDARQFIHLACHAEQWVTELKPHFDSGGSVIMDRCWWSALAYGYFGQPVAERVSFNEYMRLVNLPEHGAQPDHVFLFLTPHVHDRHNTEHVLAGYHFLGEKFSKITTVVPRMTTDQTTQFILQRLEALGFIERLA